ncbi:MAG: hypothetical protein M3Q45_13385 [Chloroflexota bacterium]|nr:hypothetical protein [Chloroflexota bacterium]
MTDQAILFDQLPAMTSRTAGGSLRNRAIAGLLGGISGGIVFGLLVAPEAGWGVHLAISALLGILFGAVIGGSVHSAGSGLVWGQATGLLWWLAGPLTLLPLLRSQAVRWDADAVQMLLPQLLGLVAAYGALMGFSYAWFVDRLNRRLPSPAAGSVPATAQRATPVAHPIVSRRVRALIVGGVGGLLGSWVFVWGLVGADFYTVVAEIVRSDSLAVGRTLHYLIGAIIGCSFGLLFDHEDQHPGNGLLDGINYGLLWWMIGPLILLPWLLGRDARPYWTLETVQRFVPSFVGHILYGALVGWFYGLVNGLWQVLFVDSDPLNRAAEGRGGRGLRAILMGQAGGMLGGLLFTVIMVGIGALPRIANLIGMASPVVGFLVHLAISVIIGMSYGLLFYRKASSYAAEIAQGLVYGWFWWVLGAVTLFALLLRQPVDWSLQSVTALYPSLVGHLLYGVGLAVFFQFLAQRYDAEPPIRAGRAGQAVQRIDKERHTARATAVCMLVLVLGVVLPLLMGLGGQTGGSGY